MGWVVKATPRPLYSRERDPIPIPQGPGWAPGSVLTGAENLAPSRIRSPDRSNPRRGEIFRARPDRSWSSPSLSYNGYRGPWMLTVHPHLVLRLRMSTVTSAPLLCQSWYVMVRLFPLPYWMNINNCDSLRILPSRLTTVDSFKYFYKMRFRKAFQSNWHGKVWGAHPEFSWRKCGRRNIFQKILTDV
jgi:hypothetical protein